MWVSQVLCSPVSLPGLVTPCEHLHQEDQGCTDCRLLTVSFLGEGRRLKPAAVEIRISHAVPVLPRGHVVHTHIYTYALTACLQLALLVPTLGFCTSGITSTHHMHLSPALILSTFLWPFLILVPATLRGLLLPGRVPSTSLNLNSIFLSPICHLLTLAGHPLLLN